MQELNPAQQNLTQLMELLNTPTNRINPAIRGKAQTLARITMGNLRMAVVGPGAVSDAERKILEEIVADPTTIFNLPQATREKLGTLQQALSRRWQTQLQSAGVKSLEQASGGQAPGAAQGAKPAIPGLKWD